MSESSPNVPPPTDEELAALATASREAFAPPVIDEESPIAFDLACVHCGYNLRTLARKAMCPECGKPVASSVHGEWLEFSDAQWVARLASGAWMMTLTPLIAAMTLPVLLILMRVSESIGMAACYLWVGSMVGLGLLGAWRLTCADPRKEGRGEIRWGPATARVAARLSITMETVLSVALSVAVVERSAWVDALSLAWLLSTMGTPLLILPWIRHLAWRAHDGILRTNVKITGIVLLIETAGGLLVYAIDYFRLHRLVRDIYVLGCAAVLAWWALALALVVLVFVTWVRLAKTLSYAAGLARLHAAFPNVR